MATKKAAVAKAPSFAEVKRELAAKLGKPKSMRKILRFPAPASKADRTAWMKRVREAGGAATISPTNGAVELCVVNGKPSALLDLIFAVGWRAKSVIKVWDELDADAGLRFVHIDYTDFKVELDRVPEKAADYAARFAKLRDVDAGEVEAALLKKKWSTA